MKTADEILLWLFSCGYSVRIERLIERQEEFFQVLVTNGSDTHTVRGTVCNLQMMLQTIKGAMDHKFHAAVA